MGRETTKSDTPTNESRHFGNRSRGISECGRSVVRCLFVTASLKPELKLQSRPAMTSRHSLQERAQLLAFRPSNNPMQQSVLQIRWQVPQGLSNRNHAGNTIRARRNIIPQIPIRSV